MKKNKTIITQEQLNFFQLIKYQQKDYSNTIELYDLMPKYFYGRSERVGGRFLDKILRDFKYKGIELIIEIKPTTITTSKGLEKAFFPSQREELIEYVLRKFATEGKGKIINGSFGVEFSLYELYKELKDRKHQHSFSQIREGLQVLNNTKITIKKKNGAVLFSGLMFANMINTKEIKGGNKKYFVYFNSLVANSIKEKKFRLINYSQSMEYKKVLSLYLHKRISCNFLQATTKNPYHIKLATIIRDSGIKEYKRISKSLILVENSLKEMQKVGSLAKYDIKKIYNEKRKNKIDDAMFLLFLSEQFVSDIKKGHFTKKGIQTGYNQSKEVDYQKDCGQTAGKGKEKTTGKQRANKTKSTEDKQRIKKEIQQRGNSEELQENKDLIKTLQGFNLSINYINNLINSTSDLKALESYIKAGQEYLNIKKDITNPALIIKKAIKDGWLPKTKEIENTTQNAKTNWDNCQLRKTERGKVIAKYLFDYFGELSFFNDHISTMTIKSFKDDKLILSVPYDFQKSQIELMRWGDFRKQKGIKSLIKELYPALKEIDLIIEK